MLKWCQVGAKALPWYEAICAHWEALMNTFEATLAVVGLFLLRLLLPLAVTFVFGYGMNRALDRWFVWTE